MQNVEFSYYRNSKRVINNISLDIKSGSKIAIVGMSGSAKSTLAKIIIGLYDITSGKIYYDGLDSELLEKKYLRKQIGIVSQDITLFNKSIYENITMDRADITEEEVIKACKIAHIYDEINEMSMKLDTYINENSTNLSGGQRQRIALARAIVNKPKILLLDEATSSLDNINEKKVSEHFKNAGCTTIVIAHRLSTIKDSDKIIVLKNGEIVEEGIHSSLIELKGEYYNLYNSEIEYTKLK